MAPDKSHLLPDIMFVGDRKGSGGWLARNLRDGTGGGVWAHEGSLPELVV